MKVIQSASELAQFCLETNREIGFVPTMGALHEGHLELLRAAQTAGDFAVVSIFVNPLQFNNAQDLAKYPRSLETDSNLLVNAGADVLFVPSAEEVYPSRPMASGVELGELANRLEGSFRPGHFEGVLQVLTRLFSLVQPTRAYFGQKDLQQCMVVRKLIEQKFSALQMVTVPTVRAQSGLALSSRNQRLSPQGLDTASAIYQQLKSLSQAMELGPALEASTEQLALLGIETEYLQAVALPDMNPINRAEESEEKALVFAGYLEGVRLIDNLLF
ncbi:MAG: pantoate--beta-alanine ligase [Bacteroidetes bacterium]|nr:pantoate--beta-alanine ligase [Bacteroidota bacterium]MDA0943867.1 pantoate--beta-alanine ligase [Bacteroidota bacterium]MDA1111498.1 pantoate--beta-alanine ligase [Bacteroidota bacterium]